jgi:hypothetical protein
MTKSWERATLISLRHLVSMDVVSGETVAYIGIFGAQTVQEA